MSSTLLAVDDSVTMRKVLEITFAGPDFRVVTANSPDAALQKLKAERFDLVIADLSLDPNGYDLCKAVKKASPATPVLLLSSKQNVYDAGKGAAAQADEHMDKPFDTQQMIDKVKKLLGTAPSMQSPAAAAAKPAASALPSAAAAAAAAAGSAPPQRAKTLIYNPPAAAQAPAPAPRAPSGPTPVSGVAAAPKPAPSETKDPTPAPPIVAPAHAATPAAALLVNGQLHAKLEQLGLTPAQVDAVAALSREVVERVVWEVVPVLAETLIKEELARLTK